MENRVVITGMGVVAPNGISIKAFLDSLQQGRSGIAYQQQLEDLGFSCKIAGVVTISEAKKAEYFTPLELRGFSSSGILYGCIAGIDAWKDAGFKVTKDSLTDFDSGTIFGAGTSGVEKFREAIYKIDAHKVRRVGSSTVAQTMASGVSAYLGGKLGLGNQVTTNSSACATGAESILMGYERIKNGHATRMLVGSCSDEGPYIWGGFDALRVTTYKHNSNPQQGCRPLSASASGFVPGSGAGALLLESLESALSRGAKIYAEVLGGAVTSGGQRNGGTMTAPNPEAVQKCISKALQNTNVSPKEIDSINGHLTATIKDSLEIENWTKALALKGDNFPPINSLKSMIGHCLTASGAIESVASVLQIKEDFIFPNTNCEDIHPEIAALISEKSIPQQTIKTTVNIVAKASFGFGDVNACVIFKKYIS